MNKLTLSYLTPMKKLPLLPCFFLLLTLLSGLALGVKLLAENLWFAEVNYSAIFWKKLFWQIALGCTIAGLSWGFLWSNLRQAQRLKWLEIPADEPLYRSRLLKSKEKQGFNSQSSSIPLPWLLLLIFGLGIGLGIMIVYYSQKVLQGWTPDYYLSNPTTPLLSFKNILPSFREVAVPSVLSLILLLLITQAQILLQGLALVFSLLFGLLFAQNWTTILKGLYGKSFTEVDPQYGLDIGRYVFTLPVFQLFNLWLWGLVLTALISTIIIYILAANSLSEGKFPGFSRAQLRHLYGLWGFLMLVLSLRHFLARYELLYSPRGVVYGGGYTDIYIEQPLQIILGSLAIFTSIWLFWKALTGKSRRKNLVTIGAKGSRHQQLTPFYFWAFLAYLIVVLGGYMANGLVQRVVVQPNELIREKPFLTRAIKNTSAAFGLNRIDAKVFKPEGILNAEVLERNHLTVDNIRIWDTEPLLETNRQLQQIRSYYKFFDAYIDRYQVNVTIKEKQSQNLSENQQVIISARELDYETVPPTAKTWVNQHLIYTHGYGFTMSPVNLVDEGGLPYYFVQDIGSKNEKGALKTANEYIRSSIPIGKPRIYFGELTNNYIMTSTEAKELDYPSENDNAYNVYDGTGGIKIGTGWKRWLFSFYLRDWRMLVTQEFTPETRLLMRRTLTERLQAIAPFLKFDRNPYLVAADIGKKDSKLFWIIDAYTVSNYYPYSDPGKVSFNYIRNSVKAVIDAYNGDVSFYIADAEDPIMQTWSKIFPSQFQPLEAMPPALRQHLRYPEDLFRVQSERLLIYHTEDPQIFYNREDQWEIPKEIYKGKPKEVKPYYLIMKLPEAQSEEFILLQPYTPSSRPNLIAWLAARSDAPEYGKLLLYQFPKQELIYGPNQIEALINQDPNISQQISLWNREGSKVHQGNLLIIPIEQSLLYVEPLYIFAEQNSVPTLARVIVVYKNKIVMEETLEKALNTIFPA
jgi:uncharacterized membrane protein (UPF0182 family)